MSLEMTAYWVITILLFIVLFALASKFKMRLWARVLLGLGIGGAMGFAFGGGASGCAEGAVCAPESSKFIGDAFVRLVRMLIVPLIASTLMAGVVAMGDPRKLGTLGGRAFGLYLGTTLVAVTLGLFAGTIFQPGKNISLEVVGEETVADVQEKLQIAESSPTILERLLNVIPDNPIFAFSSGDILAIIFFSLMFGVGILLAGDKGQPIGNLVASIADAMLKLTVVVMELAPFGVYALMSWVMATQGLAVLDNLLLLAVALYATCFIHGFITYGSLIKFVARLPVVRFFGGMVDAMAVAYSTSTSAGTLPVTIANATKNLGVSKSVAGSILPLGATINMDGAAIYLGLVALFAAQAFEIDLQAADYFMIAFTVVLASIGSAGIPSGSLFLAILVLQVLGISNEQALIVVALIFPFDRLLDMMRTVLNITGDAAVAVTVAKFEGEIDEETFKAKSVV